MGACTLWTTINHKEVDQLKRQKSALSMKPTSFTISIDKETGIFKGSKSEYKTNLIECNCMDFSVRKQPCKHMYRFAQEVSAFDYSGNIAEYSNWIKIKKQIDNLLKVADLDTLEKTLKFLSE